MRPLRSRLMANAAGLYQRALPPVRALRGQGRKPRDARRGIKAGPDPDHERPRRWPRGHRGRNWRLPHRRISAAAIATAPCRPRGKRSERRPRWLPCPREQSRGACSVFADRASRASSQTLRQSRIALSPRRELDCCSLVFRRPRPRRVAWVTLIVKNADGAKERCISLSPQTGDERREHACAK